MAEADAGGDAPVEECQRAAAGNLPMSRSRTGGARAGRCEQKGAGLVNPIHIPTGDNLADSFTKPVARATQDKHWFQLTGLQPRYLQMYGYNYYYPL